MNSEGYRDPTADKAVKHTDHTPEPVMKVICLLRDIAGLAGFEIVGRICLRDKSSGREWR
ncbi:MAG: hypothetical protein SOT60_10320 [Bilifractor sp.]|nr:hypothetical protein [Lachnospiraceae bacterium]MDY2838310.1 hypothetical protein [Bilifractor sp.]